MAEKFIISGKNSKNNELKCMISYVRTVCNFAKNTRVFKCLCILVYGFHY